MNEASLATNEINVVKAVSEAEADKTATKLDDNKRSYKANTNRARLIRNFTYELNDVEDVFTSKVSFFLKELNTQLNALVNSNIYTENKEKLDKVLKSKGEFRKELLRLLKSTERSYKDFYQKYYFEAKIFGNKAKYFRTVIEEYRRILLSRLHRQTIIDMIVKNPTITYQEVFNKLCELNSDKETHYEFNWISKAEFNNIIKQLKNLENLDKLENLSSLSNLDSSTSKVVVESTKPDKAIDNLSSVAAQSQLNEAAEPASEANIDIYAIDYSSEDDQISEFNLTDNDEYYFIEFKLKYSDYTTQSDSLLTYSCKVPKKQIKGLTTGYTKLQKFTRPRIYLRDLHEDINITNSASPATQHKLYISFNYELSVAKRSGVAATLDEASEASEGKAQVKSVDCTDSVNTWQFKTMGIDIGVAKSATAAIMTTNMCWAATERQPANDSNNEGGAKTKADVKQQNSSADVKLVPEIDFTQPAQLAISNELTISDKTKAVSEHIEILKNEQNHIYKKEKAIYDLLKLKQFDDSNAVNDSEAAKLASNTSVNASYAYANELLYNKYQRLNKLRLHLRHKVSNLKKELSFLTARDMISHAIDNNVDLIALEKLSWISDVHHATWDYNQIQQRIIHEANIYGIKVQKVACAYSSAHNPLTLEKEEVDQNRKLIKCLFDRDYAAAIILARRGIKLGKRKLKLSPSCEAASASHINESFHAVNLSIKPSLQYRQLKLCAKRQKSIISNFAYYNIL